MALKQAVLTTNRAFIVRGTVVAVPAGSTVQADADTIAKLAAAGIVDLSLPVGADAVSIEFDQVLASQLVKE